MGYPFHEIKALFDANSQQFSNSNITVSNCRSYGNSGIADKGGQSGSGIQIQDVDGATIEQWSQAARDRAGT